MSNKNERKRKNLMFLLLFTIVTFVSTTALKVAPEGLVASETGPKWTVYTDTRFDFTIEYPANWILHPRGDVPHALGERLSISEPLSGSEYHDAEPVQIEIGLYLVERALEQDLGEWSETYDVSYDEFPANQILILNAGKGEQLNRNVYYKKAISPLTPYTYTNVANGQVVWGIWMNSILENHTIVLEHLVNSIRFGKNSPETLKQAYGESFVPRPLVLPNNNSVNLFEGMLTPISLNLSNYRVPLTVTRLIKCGSRNAPVCNGTHSGAAAKAIDISASYQYVYAAATSNYYGSQWSNSGYGNLVKLRDTQDGYVAYYAHLNWFVVEPGVPIPQGGFIGQSGESGSPGNPHLHFHVQTTGGTAIDLAGMVGLTLTNDYPNCSRTCEQIKLLPNAECTCGQVN